MQAVSAHYHSGLLADSWPRLYVTALQLPFSGPALMARHLEASAPRPRSAFLHGASGPSSPSLNHGVSGIPVSQEHKSIPSPRLHAESTRGSADGLASRPPEGPRSWSLGSPKMAAGVPQPGRNAGLTQCTDRSVLVLCLHHCRTSFGQIGELCWRPPYSRGQIWSFH